MSLRIVIPVRPFDEGKTRLAAVLSGSERVALNRRLFDHVLSVAGPERCLVVSRSTEILDRARSIGAGALLEEGNDLNAALTQAAASADGPILSLSTDLPRLTRKDVEGIIVSSADIAIAPDAGGTGTNALLMRRSGLIPYSYGPGSFAAHRNAASIAGLNFERVDRPGLAYDVDEPSDIIYLDNSLDEEP